MKFQLFPLLAFGASRRANGFGQESHRDAFALPSGQAQMLTVAGMYPLGTASASIFQPVTAHNPEWRK
jgi:hypothetical protein